MSKEIEALKTGGNAVGKMSHDDKSDDDIGLWSDEELERRKQIAIRYALRKLRAEARRDVSIEIEKLVKKHLPRAGVIIVDPEEEDCPCIAQYGRCQCVHCD